MGPEASNDFRALECIAWLGARDGPPASGATLCCAGVTGPTMEALGNADTCPVSDAAAADDGSCIVDDEEEEDDDDDDDDDFPVLAVAIPICAVILLSALAAPMVFKMGKSKVTTTVEMSTVDNPAGSAA